MNEPRIFAVIAVALALGTAGGLAHAGDGELSVRDMMKLERMDKNKDKAVSKAEFLEAMGKVWDMKAKEMKLKPQGASAEEMQQILKSLYTSG